MNIDFSIIIPAKNEQENIEHCLRSIFSCDYPVGGFEVLVIDNGSSDRTAERAEALGAKVFVEPDLSISGLRNFGAQHAKGRCLAFIDADCSVFPDWLKQACRWLEEDDVACFGSPPAPPETGTWVQLSWFLVRDKKHLIEDVSWLESMNMFIRSSVFQEVGGFDESLVTCEDYDLSMRLSKLGRIVSDKRIKAIHHGEAMNVGHFYRKELWRGTSNFHGVKAHGISLSELPSLVLPSIHVVALCLCFFLALAWLVSGAAVVGTVLCTLFVLWQGALAGLALARGFGLSRLRFAPGLYLLLNVYYLARAVAMVR